MHTIVVTPNRLDRLLFAMAADASDAELSLSFSEPTGVADRLMEGLASGSLVDAVVVATDGDGDGLETVAAIDRDPILWPTPIFVVSSRANDDERVRAYARGADWYEQIPQRFSTAVALLEQLPERVAMVSSLAGGPADIDQAAADLLDGIENFLLNPS